MRGLAILSLLGLAGCQDQLPRSAQPIDQRISSQQAAIAQREVEALAGGEIIVRVVCGASAGKGFFLDTRSEGWVDDGITEGRIVFATVNNRPEVFFRDAMGRYINARQDGASINVIESSNDPQGSIWIILYAETGVVETHNISGLAPDLINLWSVNKPQTMLGRARVQAFTANCARP